MAEAKRRWIAVGYAVRSSRVWSTGKMLGLGGGAIATIAGWATVVGLPADHSWRTPLIWACIGVTVVVVAGAVWVHGHSFGKRTALGNSGDKGSPPTTIQTSRPSPMPDARTRTAATRFVQELHARWFSNGPELDRGFRVSIFMPEVSSAGREWVCTARTISPPANARKWPETMDLQARSGAGIVNYAVSEGFGLDVSGVPESQRNDKVICGRYRTATCMKEDEQDKRSWPWASMAVRVARARDGKILCVIVVEREDGGPIKLARELELKEMDGTSTLISHNVCTWELQLAAQLWAALRDEHD